MKFDRIALSGLPRSGKTTLCNLITNRFGWEVHSIGGRLREDHKQWASNPDNPEIDFPTYFRDVVTDNHIDKINEDAALLIGQTPGMILDSRYAHFNAWNAPTALKFLH